MREGACLGLMGSATSAVSIRGEGRGSPDCDWKVSTSITDMPRVKGKWKTGRAAVTLGHTGKYGTRTPACVRRPSIDSATTFSWPGLSRRPTPRHAPCPSTTGSGNRRQTVGGPEAALKLHCATGMCATCSGHAQSAVGLVKHAPLGTTRIHSPVIPVVLKTHPWTWSRRKKK